MPRTTMRSNVRRHEDCALSVIALVAMALTGVHADELAAQPSAISTIACYVALANDLGPLVDARLPDVVSASPECASPTNAIYDKTRKVNVTRSNVGKPKGATTNDPVASGNLEVRSSTDPAPASLERSAQRSSRQ